MLLDSGWRIGRLRGDTQLGRYGKGNGVGGMG